MSENKCPDCGDDGKEYVFHKYANEKTITKTGCKGWVEDPDTKKLIGYIAVTGQFIALENLSKVKDATATFK